VKNENYNLPGQPRELVDARFGDPVTGLFV